MWRNIIVICFVILFTRKTISEDNNKDTGINELRSINVTHKNNITQHFILPSKRKAVVIINNNSSLRIRGSKSKKSKIVESLLYEEYDDSGKQIGNFMMYNLNDVAKFFQEYLDTEICHVRC
ncbi:hypothetical protein K1T71_004512 [Dendrolimus kikuchii]|uniref:Uncharacterized protein n=1 Tax=Dendrolimus kikuchii TaxID=765133 RepID=A0ACC1D7P8_9NEOP|nr:hypothetical protein K1T71_004512 [Dendrolimus kikuchii]